jgi:carbon storage regulator
VLVLSRKPGEVLRIGDDILIEVMEIRGNKVRLGVKAPSHVKVLRKELEGMMPDPRSKGDSTQPKEDE